MSINNKNTYRGVILFKDHSHKFVHIAIDAKKYIEMGNDKDALAVKEVIGGVTISAYNKPKFGKNIWVHEIPKDIQEKLDFLFELYD